MIVREHIEGLGGMRPMKNMRDILSLQIPHVGDIFIVKNEFELNNDIFNRNDELDIISINNDDVEVIVNKNITIFIPISKFNNRVILQKVNESLILETYDSYNELKKLTKEVLKYLSTHEDFKEAKLQDIVNVNNYKLLKKFIQNTKGLGNKKINPEYKDYQPVIIKIADLGGDYGSWNFNNVIKINSSDFSDSEMAATLLHEMQHAYDAFRSDFKMATQKDVKNWQQDSTSFGKKQEELHSFLSKNNLEKEYQNIMAKMPQDFVKIANAIKKLSDTDEEFKSKILMVVTGIQKNTDLYYGLSLERIAHTYDQMYLFIKNTEKYTFDALLSHIKKQYVWTYSNEKSKKKITKIAYSYYNQDRTKYINKIIGTLLKKVKDKKMEPKKSLKILKKRLAVRKNKKDYLLELKDSQIIQVITVYRRKLIKELKK